MSTCIHKVRITCTRMWKMFQIHSFFNMNFSFGGITLFPNAYEARRRAKCGFFLICVIKVINVINVITYFNEKFNSCGN